ncbi:MAG: hypothetical protein D6694_11505 [Gammaproteobacteria bacterium]|nr:MAG: hypothetical protein D6694_11505 [Gammaproteobacteria bacterium]
MRALCLLPILAILGMAPIEERVVSYGSDAGKRINYLSISIIRLIADPWPFVGLNVSVKGYMKGGFIFPTKGFADSHDYQSAINVDFGDSVNTENINLCQEKYVELKGLLKRNINELYNFHIKVDIITRISDGYICVKK